MNNYMITFESYGDICEMLVMAVNRIMAIDLFEEMTKDWNEKPVFISCGRVME